MDDEAAEAPATLITSNTLATSNRHPSIQLDFSEPMATGTVRAALEITPVVPFTLTWADDQTATLTVDTLLQPGTRYVIVVGSAARTRAGQPLANQRQIVVQMAPLVGQFREPELSGLGDISISFNYPVSGESAAANFQLIPDIPATTSWDETSQTLTIQPRKRLQAETNYVLLFPAGILDEADEPLAIPNRLSFATGKAHAFGEHNYLTQEANEPLRIAFNRPVDYLAVENAFSISPSVPGALSWSGNTLLFTPAAGHWEQFSNYQVQVKTTALDEVGQPLLASPLHIFLYTARYVDVADFGDGLPVQAVLASGRRTLHYRGFNIPDATAHLALYAVPPETIVSRLLGQNESVAGLTKVESWSEPLHRGGENYLDPQELTIPADVPDRHLFAHTGWRISQ